MADRNTNPDDLHTLLHSAWGLIANAGTHVGRGWDSEHPEWVAAAERWRESFHAAAGLTPGRARTVEEIAEQQERDNAATDAVLARIVAVSK